MASDEIRRIEATRAESLEFDAQFTAFRFEIAALRIDNDRLFKGIVEVRKELQDAFDSLTKCRKVAQKHKDECERLRAAQAAPPL